MKKLSIFAAGLVAMLGVTSCSNDDQFDTSGNGSDANVSFTLELPKGLASRAFGDGTTATTLSYAVYDVTDDATFKDENQIYKDNDVTFAGLKATKNFKLVNGRTYTFVFWADKGEGSPYTFNGTGVSVDYANLTNNEEGRDAFFAVKSDIKVTGSFTQNVELYRPFAQLNLGTDDLAEEVVTKIYGENCANLNTKLTVKVPNALNLIDGTVAEQSTWAEVTFGPNGIPSGETFPVEHPEKPTKAYGYISMNYLLMPEDKSLVDVTYEFYNGTSTEAAKTINLTNVPVQRNYRTNIFGSLLTSEGNFNIEIVPGFDGSSDVNLGAKEIAEGVLYEESTKTYSITSLAGLKWLNTQTNSENNNFSGCTVKLVTDIDLAGNEWTPISKGSTFMGIFDGCGNTIHNLTTSDPDAAGLFFSARNVKNLRLENVNVTGNFKVGAITGDGLCSRIENCHVDGGVLISTPRLKGNKYDDGNNVGGITGYLSAEPEAYVKNCSVKNLTLIAYRKVGSIVGMANGASELSGNTAENVKIIANMTTPDYDGAPRNPDADEIAGGKAANANLTGNVATNVEVSIIQANQEGKVEVGTPSDFRTISALTNAGTTFEGQTIILTQDLAFDPAVVEQPLGLYENGKQNPFKGKFDGNNHTISGINISVGTYKTAAAIFGYVKAGEITNLNIKDVKISGTAYTGALIGLAYKDGSNYVKVSNVTVDGATIKSVPAMGDDGKYDGGNNVGGLIGLTQYGIDVQNCVVKNSTISGYAKVGGLFGLACLQLPVNEANHTVYENNKVIDTTVMQDITNAYETSVPTTIGEIAGQISTGSLPETNIAENVTITK